MLGMDCINTKILHNQKTRIQLHIIIIIICLLIVFIALVLIMHQTYGTIQTVQKSQQLMHEGDVHIIQSWMTIPYIAHQQHVPDTLLYNALRMKPTLVNRHLTLEEIAEQRKEPANGLIRQCQVVIINYRKAHPFQPYSTPTSTRGENTLY
jgi:hypothetical protein